MKYGFIILIAFFPAFAFAQQQDASPDSIIYKRAKLVVDSFVRSTLGIKNGVVDLITYNQFKNWFDVNATVQDDFNAVYNYDTLGKRGNYMIKKDWKPFDRYAHDVALQVKNLVIDPDFEIKEIDVTNPNNMTYSVFRKVTIEKDRKYVLQRDFASQVFNSRNIIYRDSAKEKQPAFNKFRSKTMEPATYTFTSSAKLTITLKMGDDNSFKITGINTEEVTIRCDNDLDDDAILNHEDSLNLTDHPGDFTAFGRPDYDFDGIPEAIKVKNAKNSKGSRDTRQINVEKPDRCPSTYGKEGNQGCPMNYFLTRRAIEGFVGLQFNSAGINLTELNQLGYVDSDGNNATDVLQSRKGSLKNPGLRAGIYAGGNYTYYAGRVERDIGISIGVNYTAFFADYVLDEPVMYTFKSNDSVNDYRRRVTIDSLNETIRYNIFNFPVMFSYRFYLGKEDIKGKKQRKSVMNIKAGPSFMVFNTTSEYDAFISFEGLYQTNENGVIYKDLFDEGDSYNVYLTAEELQARNPNRTAEDVFRELRNNNENYDFADSKNFRGKQKNESLLTVGFNLDFNYQYRISNEWSFKAGLQAVYAPLPERKEKYIPINKTTDSYNSIFNSSAKSTYTAFGLNAGLVYNF